MMTELDMHDDEALFARLNHAPAWRHSVAARPGWIEALKRLFGPRSATPVAAALPAAVGHGATLIEVAEREAA